MSKEEEFQLIVECIGELREQERMGVLPRGPIGRMMFADINGFGNLPDEARGVVERAFERK